MLLDIKVFREDACIYVDYALNDAVLHGYIDCIQTDVFINDVMIKSYFGDGIIVSTPTGSTGYSMSAGGPIVEPSAENFIITPICAHSLSARSYVFSSDNQVKIQAERLHGRRAYLSVDGGESLELMNGDSIIISRSSCHFSILERDRYSYYENISNKLS
jgi:NAD+ kinase